MAEIMGRSQGEEMSVEFNGEGFITHYQSSNFHTSLGVPNLPKSSMQINVPLGIDGFIRFHFGMSTVLFEGLDAEDIRDRKYEIIIREKK